MASNFAFNPMGLSRRVTVTAGTATTTLAIVSLGNRTQTVAVGAYPVNGVRITNVGTASVFVQFGAGSDTVTVGLGTGLEILANTVETFRLNGQSAMAYTSAGTTTLGITTGEGL